MATYSYGSESTTKISSSDKAKSWQGRWLLSAINAQAKAKIPAYSTISNFKFTVYAREVTNGTFNSDVDIFFANSSESSLKSLKSDDDCVYSSYSGWTLDGVASAVQSGNANAGQIVYSSADRICIFLEKTTSLATKDTWAAYYTVSCDYTAPTFKISLTAGTGGTVSGAGTYTVGSSATIKATPNSGYRFVKWSDGDTNATRTITKTTSDISANVTNLSYSAVFEKITYAVTFKDENGTTLKTATVNHGDTVTPPADPEKADTAQWNYTFDGWYDANGNKWSSSTTITAATTFTARYNSTVQTYTVRWFNHDGTLLETDTDVPYGTKPTYNGATPIKAGNAEHSYQFAGWNYDTENGITPSLGTTYIDITAQFREIDNTYKVTWVNDGVVIEEDEAVPYGDKPDYNGATPTKVSDAQYDYTFIGWSTSVTDPAKPESELETVKGDITYTAVYSATIKFYPVRVILFDTDTTLVYEYGTHITLEAPTVVGYQFVKWTDGNTDNPRTVEVKGEATYQAVYEKLPIPIFVNSEQVQAVYVNESTKTITYIIEGEIPTVNVTTDTVDGWNFEVSNTIPTDSHEVTAIYIDETKIM